MLMNNQNNYLLDDKNHIIDTNNQNGPIQIAPSSAFSRHHQAQYQPNHGYSSQLLIDNNAKNNLINQQLSGQLAAAARVSSSPPPPLLNPQINNNRTYTTNLNLNPLSTAATSNYIFPQSNNSHNPSYSNVNMMSTSIADHHYPYSQSQGHTASNLMAMNNGPFITKTHSIAQPHPSQHATAATGASWAHWSSGAGHEKRDNPRLRPDFADRVDLMGDNEGSSMKVNELRKRIIDSHLSLLNREDSPTKLEHRSQLEQLMAQYLRLVPDNMKFLTTVVASCLDKSVDQLPHFSASKAIVAFESLEKYATNLLNYPWRKEFHRIIPYGGYFKHHIDQQIVDVHDIVLLLGYQEFPDGSYQLPPEVPLDPDQVAAVAYDCLMAAVELQIMINVMDKLKNKSISDGSWNEIRAVRVQIACNEDDVVKMIHESRSTAKLIDYDGCNASNVKYFRRRGSEELRAHQSSSSSSYKPSSAPYHPAQLPVSQVPNPMEDAHSDDSFDHVNHYPLVPSSLPHQSQ